MRVLDFFFALRPLVLVPAWSFFILGQDLARSHPGSDASLATSEGFPLLRFILLSAVLAAVHLFNQIADAETDRLNAKGFFLQRGTFTPRQYGVVASLLLTTALVLAAVTDEAPLRLAAAAALGIIYSLPPLRLSSRPGLDVAANAIGYGALATWLGAGALRASDPWTARLGASMLAVAAVFLYTTLLDAEGDRRTDKRTAAVAWGVERTRRLACLCAVAAVALAAFATAPELLAACGGLAIWAAANNLAPRAVQDQSVSVGGTMLFALAASIHTPAFAAGLLLLIALTRVYYAKRFALAYPALRPTKSTR
jgi:4-hydroxybenzoate polyprenyltransferase